MKISDQVISILISDQVISILISERKKLVLQRIMCCCIVQIFNIAGKDSNEKQYLPLL